MLDAIIETVSEVLIVVLILLPVLLAAWREGGK